jgi:SAM-dependent methyltransferase
MKTWEEFRDKYRRRAVGTESMGREAEQLLWVTRKLKEECYSKEMHILDMCCGAGQYFRVLKPLGSIYYNGADKDVKMIDIAKEIFAHEQLAKFFVWDIYEPFGENKYDVVLCVNTLRHLKNYPLALRHLFMATKRFLILRTYFEKTNRTIIQYKPTIKEYAKEMFGSDNGRVPYLAFSLNCLLDICNDVSEKYCCAVKDVMIDSSRIVVLEKIYV